MIRFRKSIIQFKSKANQVLYQKNLNQNGKHMYSKYSLLYYTKFINIKQSYLINLILTVIIITKYEGQETTSYRKACETLYCSTGLQDYRKSITLLCSLHTSLLPAFCTHQISAELATLLQIWAPFPFITELGLLLKGVFNSGELIHQLISSKLPLFNIHIFITMSYNLLFNVELYVFIVSSMELNNFERINDLNPARFDWKCRLRLQSLWKGVHREKKEFYGVNMIFIDDSVNYIYLSYFL